MADDPAPARDATAPSVDFRDKAKSAGSKLREIFLENKDVAEKTYGFDVYGTQPYGDILKPVVGHEELSKRHSGGKLHELGIFVATRTMRNHEKAKSSNVNVSQKTIWLLALSVDEGEEEKIGRSFSLDIRFNVVEGEVFFGFEVV